MKLFHVLFLVLTILFFIPFSVLAATGHYELHGTELSIIWVIPFICMLLSIALGPLIIPHFWHHNFGKISVFWGLAFLIPCAVIFGIPLTAYQLLHTIFLEYIPFIVLLLVLFTVAGGVRLKGHLIGKPIVNTGLLFIGTILASWMGTTGAAMLLIRPLIRANEHRKYVIHSVIFFIFLVANIGGSLTPLGDPPLFLGFLKGVHFFWTTTHLFPMTVILSILLLTIYFILDSILYKKEGSPLPQNISDNPGQLGIEGKVNLILLLCVVLTVLMSGVWNPDISINIYGISIALQDLSRDIILLLLTGISLKLTKKESRKLNGFSWEPIQEVAKLFIGIFISMIPAITILRAGEHGVLAPVIELVFKDGQPVNSMFFWLTGILSSFLDNAPTYLVFFNTATGDATHLMGEWAKTLCAISAGSVFMGAVTYIGNAPNFMVRSIAVTHGISMPSFFGYMLWSICILFPCFILLTWLFF
ncbi:sodium:proton antiporter [Lawsonia intracellularis]|uniref:Na+/H+ antiporter NhaD and related arsenite permeases n=1 Tax=Lawsonia intracellularis (strain PHE/MN1-00) TaxID=363253 RepID=Q1MR08_LAWIP|nr:sodium:proton antiporter [Lawsonia intracellularis]AGC49928.1 citrate transporter [Lawsonia intracellularis N343]KAA0205426.1 sodium:proton antiporter [Lawsonia intracellularis]MBZ3892034.1 sodium:proton antiporter [Lawsonia intracellularis]OMQ04689.1 sodium:proton antiporter [Lawsonia intracellularis]RBN32025.1 sodium:proton antiporter [Lawsonia intracellularis]